MQNVHATYDAKKISIFAQNCLYLITSKKIILSGYIKITEGNLQPGDVLKAQSTGKVSGTMPGDFRVNAGSSGGTGNSRGVPTGGAMIMPGPGAR